MCFGGELCIPGVAHTSAAACGMQVAIGTRLEREDDFKPVGVQLDVLEGSRSGSGSSGSRSDSSGTLPLVHEDMPISAALGEHPTLNGRDCRPTACRGAGHSPHPCCG